MMRFGVRRVRLTGGEPTVRKDLVELVARLAALGLDDLAMTTNGERLVELARAAARAPACRGSTSASTRSIRRSSAPSPAAAISTRVLAGVEAAREVGFVGTKINAVVMGGVNDDERAGAVRVGLVARADAALHRVDADVRRRALRRRRRSSPPPPSARASKPRSARSSPTTARGIPGVGPARYLRVAGGR